MLAHQDRADYVKQQARRRAEDAEHETGEDMIGGVVRPRWPVAGLCLLSQLGLQSLHGGPQLLQLAEFGFPIHQRSPNGLFPGGYIASAMVR
jgi:hypothetical protein